LGTDRSSYEECGFLSTQQVPKKSMAFWVLA
jgi:hypothetical protein